MEIRQAKAKPEVLIVGAGIAGLMMGLLLEQIGIQYHIFERAAEVKPLGAAMAIASHKLAIIEQLGLYDDLLKISKPMIGVFFYHGDGKHIGDLWSEGGEE
ncbi:hypothetical protein BGZ76_006769, partial [Entomortierella beljakovae]